MTIVVDEVVEFLNSIEGRPFFGEDCTMFVERAFGKRRLFADSPTARAIGFGMRVGDPALALLKPEARLDPEAERLLRADILRALPDPTTPWNAPNGHLWIRRVLGSSLLLRRRGGLVLYAHDSDRRSDCARGQNKQIRLPKIARAASRSRPPKWHEVLRREVRLLAA